MATAVLACWVVMPVERRVLLCCYCYIWLLITIFCLFVWGYRAVPIACYFYTKATAGWLFCSVSGRTIAAAVPPLLG